MYPPQLLLLSWGYAARPFLPAGQGGLILIAGGLSMIGVAMLLLMARQRPVVAQVPGHAALTASTVVQRPRSQGLARAVTVNRGGRVEAQRAESPREHVQRGDLHRADELVWPAYLRSAAVKAGLHNTTLLSVDRTRCVIEVRHCRSCRRGRKGCVGEQRRLQKAARKLSRRARVRELSCNQGGRRVCTFHVDMGASR